MRTRREGAFTGRRPMLSGSARRALSALVVQALVVWPGVAAGQVPATAAPVAAVQDTTVKAARSKSGTTATLLSGFLPGAGHFYAGENRKGWVLLGLWAGAIAVGAGGENATSSPLAMLLVAGPWWYGVIDAHNAVGRYNRKLGFRVLMVPHIWLPPGFADGSAPRVGVAVRVGG